MFAEGTAIRATVESALDNITSSFYDGAYHPDMNAGWRSEIYDIYFNRVFHISESGELTIDMEEVEKILRKDAGEITSAKLDMLDGLTELESLWITECDVSKAGQIVNLKSLEDLELENTPLAGSAEELEIIFESCPNIETLNISVDGGNLKDLNFLRNAENLKGLILVNQSLTDYSAIAECLKLKNLSLGGCNISDVGMLTELNNLEYLNLDGTNVSEAKDILKLKNLKSLSVTNTPLAENEEQLELIQKKFLKENTYK